MGAYFLDSNAVAKRYVPELGQRRMQMLCNPVAGHRLFISQIAEVEVVFALCKWTRINIWNHPVTQKQRKRHVDDRDRRVTEFQSHCDRATGAYRVVLVTSRELQRAAELCHQHNLSGLDAIQLACALLIQQEARDAGLPSPVFVTADSDFVRVIRRYNFDILNPEVNPDLSERNLLSRAPTSASSDMLPVDESGWRRYVHTFGRWLVSR